jgi:hypothetical protein
MVASGRLNPQVDCCSTISNFVARAFEVSPGMEPIFGNYRIFCVLKIIF